MEDVQLADEVNSDRGRNGFVEDTEHGYDVLVLGLRNEFGEGANVVERALGVGDSHRAVQPIDGAIL